MERNRADDWPWSDERLRTAIVEELDTTRAQIVEQAMANVRHWQAHFADLADMRVLVPMAVHTAIDRANERVPVEIVKAYLRRDRRRNEPEHPLLHKLGAAGIDRQNDYIWARPAADEILPEHRLPNGLLKPEMFVRIAPAGIVFSR